MIVSIAASALLLFPAMASAQEETTATDALGNTGNVGSGAAFRPQTPRDIVEGGGVLVLVDVSPDIAVAGVQVGPDGTTVTTDALGNTDNVGSGAVYAPQTPEDILQGGGQLAWFEGIQVAGVQVEGQGTVTTPYRPYWRIVPPSTAPRD